MKRLLALTLLLASVAPALSDDYPRSTSFDALHYRIQLELADSTDQIAGETEILFAATGDFAKELSLDLSGMTVSEVRENSRPVKFTHRDGRLTVALEGAYRRDDRFTISITYRGVPRDGLFIKKNKFGDRTFLTD
jgi:aminopeptidase N